MARARAAHATVALVLRAGRQPDESVPACRQHAALPEGSVMGRVGPARHRFVRYYRNPVFRAFFHALPEIGSGEIDTGGWLLQRSTPGPHAGVGCLTYCFAAQGL